MTERLLVFGGAYGNLQATQALFEVVAGLGLKVSRIACTGDLAAYCADPQQTVDLVRDQGVQVVMGNCEESLAADSDDCGCGFEEDSKCSLLSREWYAYCRSRLSADAKQWMDGLPKSLKVEFGGKVLLVVHGSLTAINEFVFPSTNGTFKKDQLAAGSGDGILCGHSGIPFAELHCGQLWLNSGALGMPANDGTPRVWYALLQSTSDGIATTVRALDYDHEAAVASMRLQGLDNGYADCLGSGLWPSLDVLPDTERKRQGVAIEPAVIEGW